MNQLPLNLVVFDTAKQHWGRFDIYKTCINDLSVKIPLDLFANKVVHIKVDPSAPGEEERFRDEMVPFYHHHGFGYLVTRQSWQHFSSSHQNGYCLDLVNVYGQQHLQQTAPFTLHWESDWLVNPYADTLGDCLCKGMAYLSNNPSCCSIRIPRFLNEIDRLNNLKKKYGIDAQVTQHGKFWRYFDNLSLNPSLFRTRDLYLATRLLKLNWEQWSTHSEMGFTNAFNWMADGDLPYAIFDPSDVSCLHYGTKTGEEDKVGETFEKI